MMMPVCWDVAPWSRVTEVSDVLSASIIHVIALTVIFLLAAVRI
jgi:hypothetical protein